MAIQQEHIYLTELLLCMSCVVDIYGRTTYDYVLATNTAVI